jgi:hypothetical protein
VDPLQVPATLDRLSALKLAAMRLLFPLAGFLIAGLSILLDWRNVSADSWYCRSGLCRFNQILTAPSSADRLATDLVALLNEDPADPLVWCTYGELLAARGKIPEATAAFDRAVSLGPSLSHVLVRVAHYDLGHDREDQGFEMTNQVLRQTEVFDQSVFNDLAHCGVATFELLGSAVPATARAARSWLGFLEAQEADLDLLQTWAWMGANRLADQKSAVDVTRTLWQRKSYRSAQDVWGDWLGPTHDGYLHPQRLANTHFEQEPNGGPFDWTLAAPGVEISRHDGIDVRFSGKENADFTQVHQYATVNPGRYRLSAEISAEGITTDQGPFFHAFDPVNQNRLSVQTPPVLGNVARSWVTADLQVPPGTEALEVQIERHPSLRFDNKIAGVLHVYQVSLVPLP